MHQVKDVWKINFDLSTNSSFRQEFRNKPWLILILYEESENFEWTDVRIVTIILVYIGRTFIDHVMRVSLSGSASFVQSHHAVALPL